MTGAGHKSEMHPYIIATLTVLLISFFLLPSCIDVTKGFCKYGHDTETVLPAFNDVVVLENGKVFTQEITNLPGRILKAVNIRFATFMRTNRGMLSVKLYEDDIAVDSWNLPTFKLEDNQVRAFTLGAPYVMKKDSVYTLSLSDSYRGKNEVALWIDAGAPGGYILDGVVHDKGTGCVSLTYSINYFPYVLCIIIIFVFICALIYFNTAKRKNVSLKKWFIGLFAAVVITSFVLWLIGLTQRDVTDRQLDLFFGKMKDFLADYTNTTGYAANGDPYGVVSKHRQYPPLAYVLFWFISRFHSDIGQYPSKNAFLDLYTDPLYLYVFIISYMAYAVAIFELLRSNIKADNKLKNMVAAACMLSFPMLYTIERGNNIILAFILTEVFLFYYDSDCKAAREVALFALALAAALKIFPATYAVFLLYDKRWNAAIRVTIYGLVLGILPFALLKGGISTELPLMIRNMTVSAKAHSPFSGASLAALFAHYYPGTLLHTSMGTAVLIISYVLCALLLFLGAHCRHRWEQLLAVTFAALSISGQSGLYTLLFFIPFIVAFLNDDDHTLWDYGILFCGLLLMCAYQSPLMAWGLDYNFALLILLVLVMTKGISQTVGKLRKAF